MSVEHPPEDFVQRVLAGETSAEDVKWFERGMAMYWSNGGALSYERCLRLPATPSAMKRNTRNFWLCQAARLTTTCGVWKGPVALASALDRFITRGNWRQWQCLADPPAGAGDMDRALFFVAYNNGGEGLSIEQVKRITRPIFETNIFAPGNVCGSMVSSSCLSQPRGNSDAST